MDGELKAFLKDIRRMYQDAKVYLFGSRARGDARPESDYDLIIVSRQFDKIPFVNRGGTIWKNSQVGIAADLVCYTPEEFKKISKTSYVLKDALKYAVQV